MKKIAVVSAILEDSANTHTAFNKTVAEYKGIVKGRMGLPIDDDITVITITILGDLDQINSFTGQLGQLPHIQVKTAISKKDF